MLQRSAPERAGLNSTLVSHSGAAVGARETCGEWLAAVGTCSSEVTLVASRVFAMNGTVAALYFAASLSRPDRSSAQCGLDPGAVAGATADCAETEPGAAPEHGGQGAREPAQLAGSARRRVLIEAEFLAEILG